MPDHVCDPMSEPNHDAAAATLPRRPSSAPSAEAQHAHEAVPLRTPQETMGHGGEHGGMSMDQMVIGEWSMQNCRQCDGHACPLGGLVRIQPRLRRGLRYAKGGRRSLSNLHRTTSRAISTARMLEVRSRYAVRKPGARRSLVGA